MEEAQKRRERLRALRTEADQTGVSYDDAKSSDGLLKPFSEMSEAQDKQLCATPRFDYYTDPMSAFSANRKGTTPATQPSPTGAGNPDMTPSLAHQWQNIYPSNQQFQQMQGPTYNSGSFRSPREMSSPYAMHQASTPGTWNGSGRNNGYCYPSNFPRGIRAAVPGCGPVSSPSINYGQPQYYGGSPGHVGNRGPCSPSSGYRPVGSPSINYGRNGSQHFSNNSGYGRGGSPNPCSGRGQGRWNRNSMSPASGWSGGASKGPERYFVASMLEDPWTNLKPVVWKVKASSCKNTGGSSKSRSLESVSAKKARVSESSDKSISQPSLAEVLAAAFNEAAADEPSK